MNRQIAAMVLLALSSACDGKCQQAPRHDHGSSPPASASPAAPLEAGPERDPHAAHRSPAPASREPPTALTDYGHVSLEGLALPELRFATAKVEKRSLSRLTRTTGWVTVDETRTSEVHPKVRGYVVSSHNSFVGMSVKRGQALASLYSEGIYAAELELLALGAQQRALGEALPGSHAAQSLDAVLDATRKRFSLWDVSRGQVLQVEKTGRPSRGVTLTAPRDGVILARNATDGSYVEPATQLFLISDVSRLWVVFDIFEANMGHVSLGQEVTLECEGLDEPHKARVSFLAPVVDPATRSLRARVEVDNREGHLRPGAFSTVTLEIPVGEGLAVAEDAVIRTGKRDLVFVIDGKMAVPTEVKLGPRVGGFYRIDSGLNEGDIVATGALFLLDAESRLRAASGGMGGRQHGGH